MLWIVLESDGIQAGLKNKGAGTVVRKGRL